MTKLNWKELDEQILTAINGLGEHGFTEPTIRSVYYVLGSLNVIPLTRSGYQQLDRKITEMRKNGKIDWGFFAVKRGTSNEAGIPVPLPHNHRVILPYVTPDEWASFCINQLKQAHSIFKLPRWFKQENLVEVWVEKDGLLGATSSWLRDLEVTVRAPQGYGAWEFIHDSMKRMQEEIERQEKQHIRIIYLGDLDPSGKDIPRFMSQEAITYFQNFLTVEDLEFNEIGLSPQQVRQYNLPEQPEAQEVKDKIERDPRLKWYQEHYPRDMFVELDAFYALATDAARNLIRTTVESYFDSETFTETREEEKEMKEGIQNMVSDHVTFAGE